MHDCVMYFKHIHYLDRGKTKREGRKRQRRVEGEKRKRSSAAL